MLEMGQNLLEPDVITCSAAISTCEMGQQWEHAQLLLRELC